MQKKLIAVLAAASTVLVAAPSFADGGTDYTTAAVASISALQSSFTNIYNAAMPVMLAIVGGMVAWKYIKKLGMKV